MLTGWLTFTALLATATGTLTLAPTCRVKGHPEAELTLNCGDGKKTGVVQYWHTPFGDLRTPALLSKLDPVFMHHDGSLVVPNTSSLHSGRYYCLLQHAEGTTLWPYELRVAHSNPEHSQYEGRAAFRIRRDVGDEEQASVSDGQFAGAVAASVLLTFVLGFSAGALSRTPVLRCLKAVTRRLRSPRQQCQTDGQTMTTLPPMYDSQAFEMEQASNDDSAICVSTDTTVSSTSSSPPTKPQRSFRHKREEERETAAYLEGCDMKEEEELREEEKQNEGCDREEEKEEEREVSSFCLLEEDEESQTKTDEDKCSEERKDEDGGESREDCRVEKEDGEKDGEKKGEEDVETDTCRDSEQSSTETEDDESDSKNQEDAIKKGNIEGGEPSSSATCPDRRSRVIRLYQYDEDGQRYGHLPDPAPDEPGPAPRLKQRSRSLTRLNAIMAAASAGPLERSEGSEERPHFHMAI